MEHSRLSVASEIPRLLLGCALVVVAALQVAGLRDVISGGAYHLLRSWLAWPIAGLEGLVGLGLLTRRCTHRMVQFLWLDLALAVVVLAVRHGSMFEDGVPFRLASPGLPLVLHAVLLALALTFTGLTLTPVLAARRREPPSSFPRALP